MKYLPASGKDWLWYAHRVQPSGMMNKAVWWMLASHANGDGVAYPGLETLAERLEVSLKTVRRSMKFLEENGWILAQNRGGRGILSRYQLVFREEQQITPIKEDTHDPLLGIKEDTHDPLLGIKEDIKGDICDGPFNVFNQVQILNQVLKTHSPENLIQGIKTPTPQFPSGDAESPGQLPAPSGVVRVMPLPSWTLTDEQRNLVDLTLLDSPPGVFNGLTAGAITPMHRALVIGAAKREAKEHGVSHAEALETIRRLAQIQVESGVKITLFVTNYQRYFGNEAKYRVDPIHLQETGNGKCKSERLIDNARQAASELAKHFGSVDEDGGAAAGQRFARSPKTLHG